MLVKALEKKGAVDVHVFKAWVQVCFCLCQSSMDVSRPDTSESTQDRQEQSLGSGEGLRG